jgi:hypothetical protein
MLFLYIILKAFYLWKRLGMALAVDTKKARLHKKDHIIKSMGKRNFESLNSIERLTAHFSGWEGFLRASAGRGLDLFTVPGFQEGRGWE